MTAKSFEEEDPFELIGVGVNGPFAGGESPLEEMARTFIDEYARIGWSREKLLQLFRDPFYQGPYKIYQAKGEPFVERLISERLPAPEIGGQAGLPENRPLCNACPVGRSFGKRECPIRQRTHRLAGWLKARFLRRSPHAKGF